MGNEYLKPEVFLVRDLTVLQSVQRLHLQDDIKKLKVIHVAGTKGKVYLPTLLTLNASDSNPACVQKYRS